MKQPDPRTVGTAIEDALLRYIDTAFYLHNPGLRSERRQLLTQERPLVPPPLLEPVLPYDGAGSAVDALEAAGMTTAEATALVQGVFGSSSPGDVQLREHQIRALAVALSDDGPRNPIVTSGTGSGKTESFLLPVLARLVMEARSWGAPLPAHHWWSADPLRWSPVRTDDRPAAVRSLILYPTNALVEDQIARLRRAVRGIRAAGGPSLWFGRYTSGAAGGTTLPKVSGALSPAQRAVADDLGVMVSEFDAIPSDGADIHAYLPDPRAAELMTRWDMVATPPDVLVTNYSMLNVMLMRRLEQPMFEQTRRWLEDDRSRVFTLVVDELHLYRGTQGTEVSMILRNLLLRLGLASDSDQLRVIGTSASLGADSGEYLERFFGVPKESFAQIAGAPRGVSATLPIKAEEVAELPRAGVLDVAVAEGCRTAEGDLRATPLDLVASRVFGPGHRDDLDVALARLAEGDDRAQIPFRAHFFVRTMRGMWACSDPSCSAVDARFQTDQRTVGRLYPRPTRACDCGARVLEMLYCFTCGDVSLGGHVLTDEDDGVFLGVDPRESEAERSRLVFERARTEYCWYLPRVLPASEKWSHNGPSGKPWTFKFVPAAYYPESGFLTTSAGDATGTVVVASGPDKDWSPPALPTRCPRCAHANRQTSFGRGVVRSPIRAHTQGAAQAAQLLVSEVFSTMGEDAASRRTIVFSDSRDEAARMAVGLSANHYGDLLRQLLQQTLAEVEPAPVEIMRQGVRGILDPSLVPTYTNLIRSYPQVNAALALEFANVHDPSNAALVQQFEAEHPPRRERTWASLVDDLLARHVALGVPPGGPRASLLVLEDGTPWYRAFEPPTAGEWTPIADATVRQQVARMYRARLIEAVTSALTSRAGRDGESTAVAALLPRGLALPLGTAVEEATSSALRLVLDAGRWEPQETPSATTSTPASVVDYLERVGARAGDASIAGAVMERIKLLAPGGILRLQDLDAPVDVSPARARVWVCDVAGLAICTAPPACACAPAARARWRNGPAPPSRARTTTPRSPSAALSDSRWPS